MSSSPSSSSNDECGSIGDDLANEMPNVDTPQPETPSQELAGGYRPPPWMNSGVTVPSPPPPGQQAQSIEEYQATVNAQAMVNTRAMANANRSIPLPRESGGDSGYTIQNPTEQSMAQIPLPRPPGHQAQSAEESQAPDLWRGLVATWPGPYVTRRLRDSNGNSIPSQEVTEAAIDAIGIDRNATAAAAIQAMAMAVVEAVRAADLSHHVTSYVREIRVICDGPGLFRLDVSPRDTAGMDTQSMANQIALEMDARGGTQYGRSLRPIQLEPDACDQET